ncbi:MAG: hypothetical protein CFH05_00506 [Alphaproteobacteria bacterium MarineAlpha3_Bin4]|nr:MAG: hypothetical protein CFH05_00506 [Alphaproteobacteria bacterium MarineAlpha3_Bin4]
MFDTAANAYRKFVVRWVAAACRTAWLVVAASLLLMAASVTYLAGNIRINTATTDMLSKDLPFRQHARALSAAFPQFTDNILVVIDAANPDIAEDAAIALAERLRRNPELFGSVYDLEGSEFFRRNGLLYLDVDKLYDLSDRLAEAQPFLGTLWRDPSLRGFVHMLELAIDESLKSTGEAPIELTRVLDALAEVAEAQAAGAFGQLSWQRLMSGGDSDAVERRRFLLIQPTLNFESLQPASEAIEAIRELFGELEMDQAHGVTVRLTGSAALAQEELKSVETGMRLAGILSLALVMGLLTIGLRSARLVFATLATLIVGLVLVTAFAIAALGSLNLISVAFAVLFIGLSVDFGIHFGMRFQEELEHAADSQAALERAGEAVGGPMTLCAVSASIAFYSFLPTDYVGLAELGLIAGTGMFIALIANVTLLPALLSLLWVGPRAGRPVARGDGNGSKVQAFITGQCRPICWAALALGIAAATMATSARFDFDPLNLKDSQTESVSTLLDLMGDSRTNPYSIEILAADLSAATALAAKLDQLPAVDHTATLASYVPGEQNEKLDVITSMALFLAPAFAAASGGEAISAEERLQVFRRLKVRIRGLAEESKRPLEQRAAARLSTALSVLSDDDKLAEFERRLLAGLSGRFVQLRQSLMAEPVTIETLPQTVRERQIAVDGRARVEVFPMQNLREVAALEEFVRSVRTVAPEAIGSPVVILEAGNAVLTALFQAAAIAVGAIMVLLFLVLGRLGDMALVFVPLVLAAAMTVASSAALGLPFNLANVIVLPLLFGLGVAGGIHLVTREREERRNRHAGGVLVTSTPRAVVFSALTTIGSFGSIALSSHPGTSSMGVLLTVSISLTLASTLIFLPALMVVIADRRPPAAEGTAS